MTLIAAGLNYSSYSGCDISVTASAGGVNKKFGELLTLSYSVHREKMPVRTLGRINPKGFTRGTRTIAGSMIFVTFDRTAFYDILKRNSRDPSDSPSEVPLIDQIPPIDVTISFVNEFNHGSVIRIYGIELVDHGMSMSVDDMITEQVVSYIATGMHEMVVPGGEEGPDGKIFMSNGIFFNGEVDETTSNTYYATMRKIWELNQLMIQQPENADAIDVEIGKLKSFISQKDEDQRIGGLDAYGRFREGFTKTHGPTIPPRYPQIPLPIHIPIP